MKEFSKAVAWAVHLFPSKAPLRGRREALETKVALKKKKVKFARCGKLRKLADSRGPQQSLCKQKMATGEGKMLARIHSGQKASGMQHS